LELDNNFCKGGDFMSNYTINEGIAYPDFKLMGSDDKEHSLMDYTGKKIVLYFYSKDNTLG
jgi:peroxiredoxin Q/BCP